MKIENTQFIIVRHHNTDNPHCHIVFNRVNNEGKTISDKNDRYLNEKVCKQLKDKYNLTYGKGKDQTNIQKLKGAEKTKYEIYKAIQASQYMAKDWQQMEYLLNMQNVSIAYKYKGQTGEIQGISFKKGDYSFKGSDIDRRFSYSKLNYQLEQKQEQSQEQQNNQNQSKIQENNVSDSLLDIATGAIQAHGDDREEQQFKYRMDREENERQYQSKKKKRRRGFGL